MWTPCGTRGPTIRSLLLHLNLEPRCRFLEYVSTFLWTFSFVCLSANVTPYGGLGQELGRHESYNIGDVEQNVSTQLGRNEKGGQESGRRGGDEVRFGHLTANGFSWVCILCGGCVWHPTRGCLPGFLGRLDRWGRSWGPFRDQIPNEPIGGY
jgi:hypothetical protein